MYLANRVKIISEQAPTNVGRAMFAARRRHAQSSCSHSNDGCRIVLRRVTRGSGPTWLTGVTFLASAAVVTARSTRPLKHRHVISDV